MTNFKVVYIHGIGDQDEHFSDGFHNRLKKRLEAKNSDHNIDPIPVFWYDKVEGIMKGYNGNAKTSVREQLKFIALMLGISLVLLVLYALFIDLMDLEFPLNVIEILLTFAVLNLIIFGLFGRAISAFLASRFVDGLAVEIFWYTKSRNYYDKNKKEVLRVKNLDEGVDTVFDMLKKMINDNIGNTNDRVIVIAHSLGAVVAYDYLFNQGYIFDPDPEVEERERGTFELASFISMGTQIPIFTSAMGYYDSKAVLGSTPYEQNTKVKWLNLVDLDDPLGRKCEAFFEDATDAGQLQDKDVETNLSFSSHIAYWNPSRWRKLKNAVKRRHDDPVEIIANHISQLE